MNKGHLTATAVATVLCSCLTAPAQSVDRFSGPAIHKDSSLSTK